MEGRHIQYEFRMNKYRQAWHLSNRLLLFYLPLTSKELGTGRFKKNLKKEIQVPKAYILYSLYSVCYYKSAAGYEWTDTHVFHILFESSTNSDDMQSSAINQIF